MSTSALAPARATRRDAWALCARARRAGPPRPGRRRRRRADGRARAGEAGDDAPDPFVLVTVPRDGAADLQRALDAGADDYFTTPPSGRNVSARLSIAERRMRQAVARRRAERGLRRARWLAGIGETSIALQHEINNPLAALLGHAALLDEGLVAPEEEADALQVVVEQAQRIAT
jgi:DNA-binding response OmpR family regulator